MASGFEVWNDWQTLLSRYDVTGAICRMTTADGRRKKREVAFDLWGYDEQLKFSLGDVCDIIENATGVPVRKMDSVEFY